MFARRTLWGLQDWNSQCLNVFRWSDEPRYSSSSLCRIPGLPERSDLCKNWFPVRNRDYQGNIETVSKGELGCNHRQSIRKVGFNGKRTFLTTPTHDSDWLYFHGNFRISFLEWKHANPDTTSTAWLLRIIKKGSYVATPCTTHWGPKVYYHAIISYHVLCKSKLFYYTGKKEIGVPCKWCGTSNQVPSLVARNKVSRLNRKRRLNQQGKGNEVPSLVDCNEVSSLKSLSENVNSNLQSLLNSAR